MPVASNTVACVVTSPPYWGLRKYSGTQSLVWGGVEGCAHEWGEDLITSTKSNWDTFIKKGGEKMKSDYEETKATTQGAFCLRCGAWYGELGLEPTPELYTEHMVEIFREVRRVLHPSGTVWVNMGDSYSGSSTVGRNDIERKCQYARGTSLEATYHKRETGLKPKDLVGIPWMLAFALRADGWWLRSDIIWSKPNPMPESVTDS
jgi:DNA modification methylase